MDNSRDSSTSSMMRPTPTSSSSAQASGSGDGGGGRGANYNDSFFVGNTPSTILFFLALAVGVFIALLFIFFTIRYFIRSKYGLHVYPITHRHIILGSNMNLMGVNLTGPSSQNGNRELQEQIDYLRTHHMIRTDILERRANGGRRRRRRRRRRGRYSKMKKLTEQEVEILFPKKTYHDWLNGGKENDVNLRDGVLQEEEHQPKEAKVNDSEDNQIMTTTITVTTRSSNDINASQVVTDDSTDLADNAVELNDLSREQSSSDDTTDVDKLHELHFTSGSCAICLEVLEDEDIVRGLLCGHVFHSECLDPWLIKRRACCPMCKRDYIYNHGTNGEGSTSAEQPEVEDATNNTTDPATINASTNAPETTPSVARAPTTPSPTTIQGIVGDPDAHRRDDDDDSGDDASFDLDTFRNDPDLRAMLQELIPNSERVRFILNDESLAYLNLEARANEVAKKKYGSFFKIIWWKLMGIKKSDLFNWAVLSLYSKDLAQARANPDSTTSSTPRTNDVSEQTPATSTTPAEPDSPSEEERREVVDQRV